MGLKEVLKLTFAEGKNLRKKKGIGQVQEPPAATCIYGRKVI